MSLINDALKRAKETQPQGVAAAGPSLHPVSAQRARPDYLLPMLALVVLLLAGLLFVAWALGVGVVKVRANSLPEAAVVAPAVEVTQPVAPVVTPVAAPTNSILPKTALLEAVTNVPLVTPVVVAPKVDTMSYKLQGIFYFAKNPSAVINGKTVYAGNRVGAASVVAIGKESAMIRLGTGELKVLELP
jgi:hypothetical protein